MDGSTKEPRDGCSDDFYMTASWSSEQDIDSVQR